MPRVLIVDDNAPFRAVLRCLFEAEKDFEVCGEAGNGVEALTKARQVKPNLIILDQLMPLMNGFEAARALAQIMPEVPLFLLTADYNVTTEREALRSGIQAAFGKGEDFAPLLMNARAVCNGF